MEVDLNGTRLLNPCFLIYENKLEQIDVPSAIEIRHPTQSTQVSEVVWASTKEVKYKSQHLQQGHRERIIEARRQETMIVIHQMEVVEVVEGKKSRH